MIKELYLGSRKLQQAWWNGKPIIDEIKWELFDTQKPLYDTNGAYMWWRISYDRGGVYVFRTDSPRIIGTIEIQGTGGTRQSFDLSESYPREIDTRNVTSIMMRASRTATRKWESVDSLDNGTYHIWYRKLGSSELYNKGD